MLRLACNRYNSATYSSILDMSHHTDRMFRGDEDNLVIETGFLSQLTAQSYANHKYGFAHKTTNMPHSQEMMDYVYDGIESTLFAAIREAERYLMIELGRGLDIISLGGFQLDD